MKKLLFLIFTFFISIPTFGAQIVNVDYIHRLIDQQWGINIPFNSELTDKTVAANMKYLLSAIDVANQMLNDDPTTNYGASEYANEAAADTIATNNAVNTLIKKIDYSFFITTTQTDSFSFKISASGTFFVNWGDKNVETIVKSDTTNTTYSHNYSEPGVYEIKMGGKATGYSNVSNTAAISFSGNKKLAGIRGSLGAIFSTISNKSQPRFYQTFNNCTMLSGEIPSELFNGLRGTPVSTMFVGTFANCGNLSGQIPEKLFSDLSGAPATQLFNNTFLKCTNLTGPIPGGLFAGINGKPTEYLFDSTFSGCSGLTGAIPENLFSGISGTPAGSMFYYTFYNCSGLTSIPTNLFGNISGGAKTNMFGGMFYGCSSLVGSSAQINNEPIYNIWPDATEGQVGDMYYNVTKLDDYANIPAVWK